MDRSLATSRAVFWALLVLMSLVAVLSFSEGGRLLPLIALPWIAYAALQLRTIHAPPSPMLQKFGGALNVLLLVLGVIGIVMILANR